MLALTKRTAQQLAAIAVLAWALGAPGGSLAQAATCVPGASGALPVVDTGLPVVQIWTNNLLKYLDV